MTIYQNIYLFIFLFLISDHFIQKPCYIITLCNPGELHRGPCGLHNSFDQGKYQIELKKNTLPFIHKMKITNIHVHLIFFFFNFIFYYKYYCSK